MRTSVLLLALAIVPAGALGQSDHSHGEADHDHDDHSHDHSGDSLGAHVHGQAQLQVALEGSEVDIYFSSPAMNITGFEHAPQNDEQRAQVAEATEWFSDNPVLVAPDSDCQLVSAEVATPLTESGYRGRHADIEVYQTLNCDPGLDGRTVDAHLMARWPGIDQLQIEWVSDTGQGSKTLTPASPVFRVR